MDDGQGIQEGPSTHDGPFFDVSLLSSKSSLGVIIYSLIVGMGIICLM